MRHFPRFITSAVIFSAVIYLAAIALFVFLFKIPFSPVYSILILYFLLLTLVSRALIIRSYTLNKNKFNTTYFLVRWVKVMIHLVFIVTHTLAIKEEGKSEIISFISIFLVLYIAYSVFDVVTLNNYINKSSHDNLNIDK